MHKVSTTRAELLAREQQLKLALRGRDLLEQKRNVLVKEFMREAGTVLQHSDMLQKTASDAAKALARAEAAAGVEGVSSAAMAARSSLLLRMQTVNLMGVKVPHIEERSAARPMTGRGYAISSEPVAVDEAAAAFEDEVGAILRLAESELRMTRLSEEIQRTSRRLNALENRLIPRLTQERTYILNALDERERSDHFRLKLVKHLIESKG